jgi:hypothetical protein
MAGAQLAVYLAVLIEALFGGKMLDYPVPGGCA